MDMRRKKREGRRKGLKMPHPSGVPLYSLDDVL
jgi:hypothetical protein